MAEALDEENQILRAEIERLHAQKPKRGLEIDTDGMDERVIRMLQNTILKVQDIHTEISSHGGMEVRITLRGFPRG